MIGPLPDLVRQTRKLTVTPPATVDDTPGRWIEARLIEPTSQEPVEAAPRDHAPRWGVVYSSSGVFGTLPVWGPGDRITGRDDRVWEILTPSRTLRGGQTIVGYRNELLPLDVVYPYTADIEDQSGTVLQAKVPVAAWPIAPKHVERVGDYTEWAGQAPPEFLDDLQARNRKLDLGTTILNVISANMAAGYADLVLRDSGG